MASEAGLNGRTLDHDRIGVFADLNLEVFLRYVWTTYQ